MLEFNQLYSFFCILGSHLKSYDIFLVERDPILKKLLIKSSLLLDTIKYNIKEKPTNSNIFSIYINKIFLSSES